MLHTDVFMKSDPSDIKQHPGEIEVPTFRKMGLHPLTLSFKNGLEPIFLADYYSSSIFMFRFSFIAGFFYYGAFALLDYLIVPEYLKELSVDPLSDGMSGYSYCFCTLLYPWI